MRTDPLWPIFLALLPGCLVITDAQVKDRLGLGETGSGDSSADTSDSGAVDTQETGETGDSGETADSTETGDTAEAGDTDTSTHDADGDGYDGTAPGNDCDDSNPDIHPGATEICDGVDNNCDGQIDEAGATGETSWYADADGDGYGDPDAATLACDAPAGTVADDTDCDDTHADINPGETEICDSANADEDCDGLTDDGDPSVASAGKTTWYRDADGDNYGVSTTTTTACDRPSGYAALSTDCDDSDAAVNPGAAEIACDRADNNCDGIEASTDADGDGYTAESCDSGTDCDDSDADIHPGATEICDGVDNDCDGSDLTQTAVEFDTTTDAVTFADSAALDFGGSWTVEAWVYPTSTSTSSITGAVFTKGNGTIPPMSAEMKIFELSLGAPEAAYNVASGAPVLESAYPYAIVPGKWNHVAWVGDADQLRLYIAGAAVLAAAIETDANDGAGSGALGYFNKSGILTAAFLGYLSDVRISNYARYSSTFTPAASLSSDAKTVVHWALDEGTGTTATDDKGGVTGTLSGASWVDAPCRE